MKENQLFKNIPVHIHNSLTWIKFLFLSKFRKEICIMIKDDNGKFQIYKTYSTAVGDLSENRNRRIYRPIVFCQTLVNDCEKDHPK